MPDKKELQDPLKSLDQVCKPDDRQKDFIGSLEDLHAELKRIVLNDSVPAEVRQLFETAKNLSLYSWFVYRFHQVSELIAFSALEMALRQRYLSENPIDNQRNKRKPSLYSLLQHAKNNQWITNEGFPDLHHLAKEQARFKKQIDKMKTHDFDKEPAMQIDEPSQDEIEEALASLDRVKAITEVSHKLRNDLAHGSSKLYPGSVSTLQINAQVINQVYPQ